MTAVPIAAPELGAEEKEQVLRIMDDGQLADGPEVRRFEADFAAYCGSEQAIATTNGTTALHAALKAVGIGPGDEVVTTPFSFIATANAIRHAGAEPVFADIDPDTYNLDPAAVESVLAEREIDAILPVHLYGLPADMDPLLELAESYDIPVVEDAAQAHGAEYKGERVGSLGDVGCFSFYPTKNMTTGEGGAIVTDRSDVADRARRFIDHGRDAGADYDHVEVGHNFRMTSMAAAIGRVQLEKLPAFTQARRDHASELIDALEDTPGIEIPVTPPDRRHVFHQFTIRCADRDAVQAGLDSAGVDSAVYYPSPIHRQPPYRQPGGTFPSAERSASEVLSLPVHPSLTPQQLRTVAEGVKEAVPAAGGFR